MRIETFYVVTYPTKQSTLADICFDTDKTGLMRQFLGGLSADSIEGIYTDQKEAEWKATSLIIAARKTAK